MANSKFSMWSRRKFIFSILSTSAFLVGGQNGVFAFGAKRGNTSRIGPHLLASEYWPPAITCNFIDVFDGNLCCQADEFGRLATANILAADPHSHIYSIMGETSALGNKVLFMKVIQSQLAAAVVWNKDNETEHATSSFLSKKAKQDKEETSVRDGKFACVLINLSAPQSPQIVSNTDLPTFSQLTAFATNSIKNRPLICIAGTDFDGHNRISLYGLKGRLKLQLVSSFTLTNPIEKIMFGDQDLLVFHDTAESQASIVSLNNLADPQFVRTVKLENKISEMAYCRDNLVWSSEQDSDCLLYIGDIKTFPKASNQIKINGPFVIEALSVSNKHVLALGNNDEENILMPFLIDKNHSLSKQKPITLTGYMEDSLLPSKIVFGKDNAFISSGWAGVQVLTPDSSGKWSASTCFSMQKLPVAGCVSWSNYLLMAADNLRLYDLTYPKQPKLVSTNELPSTVKTIAAAGSYVLCLDKSGLALRKIENPKQILATLSINAEHLSFDKENHKAYLIQSASNSDGKKKNEQAANLVELNVYNNSIEISKTFPIIEGSYCSSADEGHVVIGNMDGLAIYKPDEENKLVCQRQFKDLAWRDIMLSKGNIFATAIDHNVNGYFLTMSFDGQEISLLDSIKIPHDCLALRTSDNSAFVIGQKPEGGSLLTTIDISNMAKPNIVSSKSTIESASTITVDKNLVIIAGQGFQVFSIQ